MNITKVLIALFCMINISTYVLAVECGKYPTDGCEVSQSTTFEKDNYYLPAGIDIVNDDIVLDCNGSTLIGAGSWGVDLFDLNNITMQNCTIMNYSVGIWVDYVYNLSLMSNDISYNEHGIAVYEVMEGEISDNTIHNNYYSGIEIYEDIRGLYIRRNVIVENDVGIKSGYSKKKKAKKKVVKKPIDDFYEITDNKITNNQIGLLIEEETPLVNGNMICSNRIDIQSNYSHGDGNTCDVVIGWNDDGTNGCSYSCCQDNVPEFTFLGSFLAVAGLGIFIARKRKKAMIMRKSIKN